MTKKTDSQGKEKMKSIFKRKFDVISVFSVFGFIISFIILLGLVYLLNALFFYTFLIENMYFLIIASLLIFLVKFLTKSEYEFSIIILLIGLSGYAAMFSSMMRNIMRDIFSSKSFVLVKVIFLFSMTTLNTISGITLTYRIIQLRLLGPLRSIIKAKKGIETELRNQKRELSMFNRIMTHDIKSYLTNIKGYSQLYLEIDEEAYEIIERQINQIHQLLNNSLKLANAGKIIDKKELVDLNKIITNIVEDIVPNNIEVVIQSIPLVSGDKQKLRQAFKNILENAIIHGSPQKIEISSRFEKKDLHIHISNDGNKISRNIIKNFTSKDFMNDLKKNHLGLKIIKRIINAHGWDITIKNVPITTYILCIPERFFKR